MHNVKRIVKDRISDALFTYRRNAEARFLKGHARILIYHAVENSNPAEDKMGLAVTPSAFHEQMAYLKENGFRVTDLSGLVQGVMQKIPIQEKSVVITFDDGYKSVLTNALPVLKEFGFPATVFINVHFIERKLQESGYWRNWKTLGWEEVKHLSREGISMGSHALTHQRLTRVNPGSLYDEIVRSREIIEEKINNRIDTFCYPHGAFNRKVIEILKDNNFHCACSGIPGTADMHSDIFALRRTEITAFDDTRLKFMKKLLGCYDWIRYARWNVA